MNAISTTLATTAILAVVMNCSAQESDPLGDAAVATVISGPSGNSVISDNGHNAFVNANGDGTGVIFGDRGTTTIWKMGGTTFIIPTGNPPASQRNRQR